MKSPKARSGASSGKGSTLSSNCSSNRALTRDAAFRSRRASAAAASRRAAAGPSLAIFVNTVFWQLVFLFTAAGLLSLAIADVPSVSDFGLFGAIGILWAIVFWMWFRDNPSDHPAVNEAELELLEGAESNASGHGDVPWMRLLASRSVWMLWIQYFCMAYGWYFYITWLPTYLQEERDEWDISGGT